ncbi:hypothetical protein ACIRQH_20005 [Streptomyces sp. NPDC102279]|uniref:hypothetical protein n=1 Tax=Streptomyces sp. NPDC102279 TaxID=3366153 RepID=UPI0037FB12DE
MTAYSRAYEALTGGRPLSKVEAAALLGTLRQEFGQELADALVQVLDVEYEQTKSTGSSSGVRLKRQRYGAAIRTVNRIREFATNPRGFTPPAQHDPRSTS